MRTNIQDKVVVITGASSGIGRALAIEFASRGAKLVIAARSEARLVEAKDDVKKTGAEVIAVPTDVSNEVDCKYLIQRAIDKFGGIDVMINNAGISMRALFTSTDLSVLKQLMDINFWGTVYCSKYALPYLLESKGSLVGVSSIAGYKGLPGRTGYSASKFAMHGFLETLRIENMKKGLHVLIACPGFTASNIRNTALEVSVPLHDLVVNEILQLGQGSVLEMDKLAGEPLEVLVQGRPIGKGEVVVINEKFGVRLTDIISPSERIEKMS